MSTAAPTQNGNGNSHTIELPAQDLPKKKVPHPPGHCKEGQPLTLPPGFTTQTFAEFITAARKIIEDQKVTLITDTAQLNKEQYMDPSKAHDLHNIVEKKYFVASAVLSSRDVKDVQDIMRLCNEFEMPIWPFSMGRNTGYGGAAPRVPGSIALDLGRQMNKILEVNVGGAFALVEPGVTFLDPHEYLVKNNLRDKLCVDVPDVGGGSTIGNAVERGVVYAPYGDHWMMHCGMEVVVPSGELIRTGMGALPDKSRGHAEGLRPDQTPGNRAWQLFNYGFGPDNDGIFSQSNLRIVTKMGIWQMVPQNVPTLRHILLDAAVSGNKKSYTDKDEPLNEDELDAIAKKMKLGRWNFYGAVHGPQPVRDVWWQTIKQSFSTIEGAQFILPEETRDHPVLQTRHGTLQGMREMQHIVCIVFDRYDKAKRDRTHWLIRTLLQDAAEHGWGAYRTHLALMDQISDTYSFNDHAQRKLNETIKNALDPKGILAPGKNGVWPSIYNREAWRIAAPDAV